MKKFINILFVALLLTCISCKAQPVPEQPVKDLETGLFCELPDSNTYQFEGCMVEDFIYDAINDQFIIEYADENVDNYGGYIQIECTKEDFFDVLTLYADEYNYSWVDNYRIKEVFTAVDGGINIRYYLIKT